jgi:pilus assembly protein Flp/PilA
MLQYFRALVRRRNEDGASAVEYGLLVAAIAALIVLVVFALGKVINEVFKKTCNNISGANGANTTQTCP